MKKLEPTMENSASALPEAHGSEVLLGTMLVLSGTAGLIFQVLWIRQLSLVVGVEIYSITIAVSSFFAGLAVGSIFLGRLADRHGRPMQLYGFFEAAVALTGVAATLALAHAAQLFTTLNAHAGGIGWLLPFLLVATPALFMGGTLPAAIRCLSDRGSVARAGARIYAANTAGGIAGALLASFALIPCLGIRGTSIVAAILNLLAAGIAVALDRRRNPVRKTDDLLAEGSMRSGQARTALVLYSVAGGIALGYEVVWSQALAQFLSTRVFAFSMVLATYLAGLALGSALYARYAHRLRDGWGIFGFLIAAAGVVALLEIAGLGLWQLRVQTEAGSIAFSVTGSEFARMCAQFAVAAIGVVFVPTVLLGAAFPAVLRLVANRNSVGSDSGLVLALNTAGGIAGTMLTGLVLVPSIGVVRTLEILAIAAAAVGTVAVLVGPGVSRRMQWCVAGLGLVVIATSLVTPADRLARLLLTTRGGGALVFYKESRGATVAVAHQQSGDNVFRRLYIQGVSNSGDAMPSLRYMRLQAMLPLIIHNGEPKSALVIGFGTGITAGGVLHYPNLQRRVCVELLPQVVQAGKLFPENYGASTDGRLDIRIGDGRQELMRSSDRYDVITLEPPPPSAEGVVNLYSTDFYRLASRRLERGGLLAQWLPIATQNEGDTRSLVRAFLDVFPYATLWTTELHEMMLIGSAQPIELNMEEISGRFEQEDVSRALQAVGIASPAALLATWVTGRDGLERYADGAAPVTDDRPRIEYSAWVKPTVITRTLPELLATSSEPPLVGADEAMRVEVARRREELQDFYSAGLAAYNGDRDGWARAMHRVLTADGSNPYYTWIVGRDR